MRKGKGKFEVYESNLKKFTEGEFDNLRCGFCGKDAVSVYFTKNILADGETRYSVYFVCLECGNWDRASYKDDIPHFDENRVHPDFQRKEDEIWKEIESGES